MCTLVKRLEFVASRATGRQSMCQTMCRTWTTLPRSHALPMHARSVCADTLAQPCKRWGPGPKELDCHVHTTLSYTAASRRALRSSGRGGQTTHFSRADTRGNTCRLACCPQRPAWVSHSLPNRAAAWPESESKRPHVRLGNINTCHAHHARHIKPWQYKPPSRSYTSAGMPTHHPTKTWSKD